MKIMQELYKITQYNYLSIYDYEEGLAENLNIYIIYLSGSKDELKRHKKKFFNELGKYTRKGLFITT